MLEEHARAQLSEEELRAADAVVDLDAEETECPACLTRFRTEGVSRCPECGLNFG